MFRSTARNFFSIGIASSSDCRTLGQCRIWNVEINISGLTRMISEDSWVHRMCMCFTYLNTIIRWSLLDSRLVAGKRSPTLRVSPKFLMTPGHPHWLLQFDVNWTLKSSISDLNVTRKEVFLVDIGIEQSSAKSFIFACSFIFRLISYTNIIQFPLHSALLTSLVHPVTKRRHFHETLFTLL